jgi:chaperonin cofactor prefoldin
VIKDVEKGALELDGIIDDARMYIATGEKAKAKSDELVRQVKALVSVMENEIKHYRELHDGSEKAGNTHQAFAYVADRLEGFLEPTEGK